MTRDDFVAMSESQLTAFFRHRHWVFLPANDKTRSLARRILQLPVDRVKRSEKDMIAGGVMQLQLDAMPEAAGVKAEWHEQIRATATRLALPSTHHIQAEKLLVASPGKGEQVLHLDRDDNPTVLRRVHSIILYATPGARSTAMPRFRTDDFALPRHRPPSNPNPDNEDEMRDTYHRGLLSKDAYESFEVDAGDSMVFAQSVPHFGTGNSTMLRRVALFSLLTPFAAPKQDDYQIFRWMYVERAFDGDSFEFAQTCYEDRDHNPLGRFGNDTRGKAAREIYLRNLQKWGVLQAHLASVEWLPPRWHRQRRM